MRELEPLEAFEVFAPAVFAAFVIGGMMGDPNCSPDEKVIDIAWRAGDKMAAVLIERLKKLQEKEKGA